MLNNISLADDYTEPFYIAEESGIHAALEGTMRPLFVEQRDVIQAKSQTLEPHKASLHFALAIKNQIVTWDNKDAQGQPVPITHESVRTLRPRLQDKLWQIIAGVRSSDIKAGKHASSADVDLDTQAILEGRLPGDLRQEAAAKN